MLKNNADSCRAYTTKDGSEIRELMHPSQHGNRQQSLAEARVLPGQTTQTHRHHHSEELYYILSGVGEMHRGDENFTVSPGDCVAIAPGVAHAITNTGQDILKFLCCCSPPYAHDDTELRETAQEGDSAACAAARRAMGTRGGEQET